jgi:hypothetical protein
MAQAGLVIAEAVAGPLGVEQSGLPYQRSSTEVSGGRLLHRHESAKEWAPFEVRALNAAPQLVVPPSSSLHLGSDLQAEFRYGSSSTDAEGCTCRSMSASPKSELLTTQQRNDVMGQTRRSGARRLSAQPASLQRLDRW